MIPLVTKFRLRCMAQTEGSVSSSYGKYSIGSTLQCSFSTWPLISLTTASIKSALSYKWISWCKCMVYTFISESKAMVLLILSWSSIYLSCWVSKADWKAWMLPLVSHEFILSWILLEIFLCLPMELMLDTLVTGITVGAGSGSSYDSGACTGGGATWLVVSAGSKMGVQVDSKIVIRLATSVVVLEVEFVFVSSKFCYWLTINPVWPLGQYQIVSAILPWSMRYSYCT